jgi:hypothetical protein
MLRRLGLTLLSDAAWESAKIAFEKVIARGRKATIRDQCTDFCDKEYPLPDPRYLMALPKEEIRTFLRIIYLAIFAVDKGYKVDWRLLQLNSVIHNQKAILKGLTLIDVRLLLPEEFAAIDADSIAETSAPVGGQDRLTVVPEPIKM